MKSHYNSRVLFYQALTKKEKRTSSYKKYFGVPLTSMSTVLNLLDNTRSLSLPKGFAFSISSIEFDPRHVRVIKILLS